MFISKSKATPHIQLDTMQLFDTVSDCERKLQTLELIREHSSEAIQLYILSTMLQISIKSGDGVPIVFSLTK